MKYATSLEAIAAHLCWIDAAERVRECRNRLVHGRLGIEPDRQHVINVVGLATSPGQEFFAYSILALQSELDTIKSLRAGLHALGKTWPV